MFTFDDNIVSDLHKDAFGFRPDTYWWREWCLSTDAAKQEIWDGLLVSMQYAIREEQERETRCIQQFENWVAALIHSGAVDRNMAIRWIAESHQANGDLQFLCYLLGIPYDYLNDATI